ncbi:hypothetical protein NIES2107_29630 [Nostoc carneum NIES-2107]|nr:hypothetical protein NIES2107_29630 [Nostoc carneum NIES-2107]
MESDRNQELEQRERELRQREVELRLREMEAEINPPVYKTVKHQPEKLSQPLLKNIMLGAKLFAIAVAVLVAVRIAAALAGMIMFAALVWLVYKLFLESSKNQP